MIKIKKISPFVYFYFLFWFIQGFILLQKNFQQRTDLKLCGTICLFVVDVVAVVVIVVGLNEDVFSYKNDLHQEPI